MVLVLGDCNMEILRIYYMNAAAGMKKILSEISGNFSTLPKL